jgi:hypothetical protein
MSMQALPGGSTFDAVMQAFNAEAAAREASRNALRRCHAFAVRPWFPMCPRFGIDVLHKDADGRPLFKVRLGAKRTKVLLNAQNDMPIAHYAANVKIVLPNVGNRPDLVPGCSGQVGIAQRAFKLRYADGCSARRIARLLNDENLQSCSGRPWGAAAVEHLVKNPLYLGVGIACRTTAAVFYRMNVNGSPEPVRRTEGSRLTLPQRRRPQSEWVMFDFPMLREAFVDPADRPMVLDRIISSYTRTQRHSERRRI